MRIFIAADISNKDNIERLQQEIATAANFNAYQVKPVEKQNFHFTLFFLGEIQDTTTLIDKIKLKLTEITFKPIPVLYTGIGTFPYNSSFPKIIWLGVDKEAGERLIRLAEDEIPSRLVDLGFKPDKKFVPHITLFRIKKQTPMSISSVISRYVDKTFGSDTINKIQLLKSELRPSGPVYTDLHTVIAK